jgi:hypothetical protein
VRVFKTKALARYVRREKIPDTSLFEAVMRAENGLIDADLGGNVIKQRVARAGQGRSGGYRLLIAFRAKHRAVFLLGFAKNERDNIDDDQLAMLKKIAAGWLGANAAIIDAATGEGSLVEIKT